MERRPARWIATVATPLVGLGLAVANWIAARPWDPLFVAFVSACIGVGPAFVAALRHRYETQDTPPSAG